MATPTKITLSQQELQLVSDSSWILTKRAIVEKVYQLLGDLSITMKELAVRENNWLPAKVITSEAKIYRGENYRLLPYVLMDYPRYFEAGDVFAIRTMFWWGNFFSITLHLGGNYKKIFEERVSKKLRELQQDGFYICINEDQWQHHFEADNYVATTGLEEGSFEKAISGSSFIKLALQFPLQLWDEMPELLERSFGTILQLLKP